MEYFNLNNKEIKGFEPGFVLDLNHDGRIDLAFTTQLIGDAINKIDKLQFMISSNKEVNLPVNFLDCTAGMGWSLEKCLA